MEKFVISHLFKPQFPIRKTIINILLLIGACLTSSFGLAQDGSEVTFEAQTISVEQKNNVMVAKGKLKVIHNNEILEAQSLIFDRSTGIAKAIGEVKLKNKRWCRISSR